MQFSDFKVGKMCNPNHKGRKLCSSRTGNLFFYYEIFIGKPCIFTLKTYKS